MDNWHAFKKNLHKYANLLMLCKCIRSLIKYVHCSTKTQVQGALSGYTLTYTVTEKKHLLGTEPK